MPERSVRRIARHFGVSEEWLTKGTGDQYPSMTDAADAIDLRVERLVLQYQRIITET